jgi:hypothetical protein
MYQKHIVTMTFEIRNSPLPASDTLTHVSAATDKNKNIRETARHSGLYSVPPEIVKELVQSSFEGEPSFDSRNSVVREFRS